MQEASKTNGHSLPPNQRAPREITMNEEELKDLIYNATSRDTRALRQLMLEKRDYDAECDYPKDLTVQDHYKVYFDIHAVATRVCEVLPLETWQVQPSVYEDDDPNVKTEFEKAWDELGSSLRGQSWHKKEEGSPVWEYLKRADILSGIGSFGVILLGFDDGQPLNTPIAMLAEEEDPDEEETWEVSDSEGKDTETDTDTEGSTKSRVSDETDGPTTNATGSIDSQYDGSVFGADKIPKLKEGTKRKLVFMRPFDESLVQVTRLETDINSPRHNQPVMYRLTLIDPEFAKQNAISMDISCPEVHWTRILHVADNLTNSECFGVPRQQPVYRHLRNLYKLYGGAPEMYWRGAMNGISWETHPQLGGDVEVDKEAFRNEMENMRNGLQRDMISTGFTAKSMAPTVSDPTPFIDGQITAICIKLGCPQRIFMGSERGELASTQDDSSWNDRLKHRQEMYVTPRIIIPFIDRMILTGVLPKPQGKIIEENLTEDDGNDQEVVETPDSKADTSFQGKEAGKPTANAFGKPPSTSQRAMGGGSKGKASPFGGKPPSGAPSASGGDPAAPAPAEAKARKLPEKDASPGYCITWPDLDSMTDAQKATIALQKTQALMAFIAGNGESAMTLVDFYTKVLYLTDEEAIGVITAVNKQIEDDERLTPDPEEARQDEMDMQGEQFDKELEAKKQLAESGQGFQAAMFDKQTEVEDKRIKNQPKGRPVANFNTSQPRDNEGQFSSGGGKSNVPYTLTDSEKKTALTKLSQMRSLTEEESGDTLDEVNSKEVFPHVTGQIYIMGAPKEKQTQVREVALDKLISVQPGVSRKGLEAYIDHPPNKIPLVVKIKGELYIQEGHTRLGAQVLAGRTTAKVRYAEYKHETYRGAKDGGYQKLPTNNLSALDKARMLVNYSPNQPRDSEGKFGSGSGGGKLTVGQKFPINKEYHAEVLSVDEEDDSVGGELATVVVYKHSASDKPVGTAILVEDDRTGEWTLGVHELNDNTRGKGLGRQLIPKLADQLGVIHSDTDANTPAAKKMWEAIGGEKTKSGYKITGKQGSKTNVSSVTPKTTASLQQKRVQAQTASEKARAYSEQGKWDKQTAISLHKQAMREHKSALDLATSQGNTKVAQHHQEYVNSHIVHLRDIQRMTTNYSKNQPRDAEGKFGSGGSKGSAKATKAETAKASAVPVGKEIQNYAKANEASIAKKLGGVSFPDSEPVDVVVPNAKGVAQHGIEMKTMVKNGNFKLTMDGYAQARKVNWEKSNQATFHTLVVDDHAVFNAKGPGKHDYSQREYYYRRGVAGSARVAGLHKAKNLEEVKQLMAMDEKSLPKAAQRTDKSMRNGTWKPFTDEKGKGFKNKKTGETVRAKK